MAWDRAYSSCTGRVYVTGFRMRLQDPMVQFRLIVPSARVDVVLWELVGKTFRASYVKADGVSYRMLTKVDRVEGREERLAAFPVLEGFKQPALLDDPPPPPLKPEQIAKEDCHYERQGACNLFVAFEPLCGQRDVTVTDRRTKSDECFRISV